jgi:uncharacterized protein YjbJ (UPF0337 family)
MGIPQTGGNPLTISNQPQENTMNKDQTAGRIDEVKGKVKEVAGKIVGNKELEVKGKVQHAIGKNQASYGDLKADIKKGGA